MGIKTRPVKLQYVIRNKRNVHMMTLKVNFQDILTRTVKKMKILICSQWPIQKWICGYPNHQLEDCLVTKTVNPHDATRKEIMTKTVKVITICVITSEIWRKLLSYVDSNVNKCYAGSAKNWLSMNCTQPEITRNIRYSTNKCWCRSINCLSSVSPLQILGEMTIYPYVASENTESRNHKFHHFQQANKRNTKTQARTLI